MRRRWNPLAIVAAVIVVCVLGLLIWACVGAAKKPAAAPVQQQVSVVHPWCIDPVAMTLLDDDWCERDDDHDGYIDGHWYVPEKGLVKPARGAKLPPQVKLGSPNHVLRIPVQVRPRPSASVRPSAAAPAVVVTTKPATVKATPKRTGSRP